ncbi:MAG: hypothetical protein FWE13_03685, partial [Firmicutes bacterium]|nr:hypothetical protein [Bacillota bacterium]
EAAAPEGSSEGFRWQIEISNSFATGNATGVSAANAYVSAFIARIANSENPPPSLEADITIKNVYSTGISRVQLHPNPEVTAPLSNNRVAGGIFGRFQARNSSVENGSILTVQNAFATGNVFGDSNELAIDTNTSIGILFGRAQQPTTHHFSGLFYSMMANTTGQTTGASVPRSDGPEATVVTLLNLQNPTWQAENLGFDAEVWAFVQGSFPILRWIIELY